MSMALFSAKPVARPRIRTIPGLAIALVLLLACDTLAQAVATSFNVGSGAATRDGKPRLRDGRIDYLEIMNRHLGKGVTTRNNAAVLVIEALGPRVLDGVPHEKYLRYLGISAIPARDHFLARLDELEKTNPKNFLQIRSRPWTRREFPESAQWLAANQEQLDLIVKASLLPRYFQPLVSYGSEENPWMPVWRFSNTLSMEYRDVSEIFVVRAMNRLGEADIPGAIEDLKTIRRISVHLTEAVDSIGLSLARAVAESAQDVEVRLLECGRMTRQQIEDYRTFLRENPSDFQAGRAIGLDEKLRFLEVVQAFRRMDPDELEENLSFMFKDRNRLVARDSIDWSIVTDVSGIYTEIEEVWKEPSDSLRLEQLRRIEERIAEEEQRITSLGKDEIANLEPGDRNAIFGTLLYCMDSPSITVVGEMDIRARSSRDLSEIALALELFRLKYGKFPSRLEELKPEFLETLPVDRFSDEPLRYVVEERGYLLYSTGPNRIDDRGAEWNNPPGADDVRLQIKLARMRDP